MAWNVGNQMSGKAWRRLTVLAGLAVATAVQTGCSADFGTVTSAGPQIGAGKGVAISGIAKGGQPPVTGATIQLYAVGTTGYGSNATPLLSGTPVTSNAAGGFTIAANSYTCPSNSYVYITASSGNPGLSGNNTSLALMAALGPCSGLSSATYVSLNELTTVAAVWSLAQFGSSTGAALSTSSYTGVPTDTFGTSSMNLQGVANAMQLANVLVNTATGTSPGVNTSGNAVNVEYWHINTIANILASCVNSVGASSSNCTTLFQNTGNSTDTIQAALYMAKNPTANVSALAALSPAYAQFQPTDTITNDFTIGLSYSTAGTGTRFIAIDQSGNAWIPSNTYVNELDPTGNVLTSVSSYSLSGNSKTFATAYQAAIDTANNAYVTDQSANTVVAFSGPASPGTMGTVTSAVASGSNSGTEGIAVDGVNNVWYTTTSGKLYELASGAYTTPIAGLTTTAYPYGVAVDLSNKAGSTNNTASQGASFIYEVNMQGCSGESLGGATNGFGGSIGMAYGTSFTPAGGSTATAAGSATPVSYLANAACNTSSKIATSQDPQNAANGTSYVFMSSPTGLAVDNSNNLWIVNQNYVSSDKSGPQFSLTKVTQNYSSSFTGANTATELSYVNYAGGGLTTPWFIAMDGAGSAWVADSVGATTATASANSFSQGYVSAFSNAGTAISPTTGLYGGVYTNTSNGLTTTYRRALINARGMAVDPSGNVWVSNSATFTFPGASAATAFVTEIVGAAVPTVTPLSLGVKNDTLASRP